LYQSPDNESTPSATFTSLKRGNVVFGKFEIDAEIGRGGMGVVLRVKDTNLDKLMALKVLNGQVRDSNTLRRFQNEARNASRLSHYAIAQIYDFGVSDFGEPYMAIELVSGETLHKVVRKNACLSLEEFLTIFKDISSALEAAHGASIVHRDLKPGNIIVFTDESKRKRAKLLDFGISKRIDMSEEELGKLTSTGQVLGTPLYLSPEQASGAPATVLSDLYSLGCVMYFALSGKPPFLGETAFDTLLMHRESQAEPVVESAAGEILPEKLTELIASLLSKKAAERPPSARAVRDELERALKTARDESHYYSDQDEEEEEAGKKSGVVAGDPRTSKKTTTMFLYLSVAALLLLLAYTGLGLSKRKSQALSDKIQSKPATFPVSTNEEVRGEHSYIAHFIRGNGNRFDPQNLKVTDDDLKLLSNYRLLEFVNLKGCPVTSSGLMSLRASKDRLVKLNLSFTDVESLAFIKEFPKLSIIDLSSCTKIEDSDIEQLETTGQIIQLDLTNTNVSGEAIRRIARKKFFRDRSIVISVCSLESNKQTPAKSVIDDIEDYNYSQEMSGIKLESMIQLLADKRAMRKLRLFEEGDFKKCLAYEIYRQTEILLNKRNDARTALNLFGLLRSAASDAGERGLWLKRDCLYAMALASSNLDPKADIRKFLEEADKESKRTSKDVSTEACRSIILSLYSRELDLGHYKSALLLDSELVRNVQTTGLSHMRYRLADQLKANRMFNDALRIFRELRTDSRISRNKVLKGETLAGIAECLREKNDTDSALKTYMQAIDILKNEESELLSEGGAGEHLRRVLSSCYYNAAEILRKNGKLKEALSINTEGRNLDKRHHDALFSKPLQEQEGLLRRP